MKGKLLGGARVIPLAVREEILTAFEKISREHRPVISVRPFRPARIGVVTTGSEIQSGRIQDKFWPVLEAKAKELGAELTDRNFRETIRKRSQRRSGNSWIRERIWCR